MCVCVCARTIVSFNDGRKRWVNGRRTHEITLPIIHSLVVCRIFSARFHSSVHRFFHSFAAADAVVICCIDLLLVHANCIALHRYESVCSSSSSELQRHGHVRACYIANSNCFSLLFFITITTIIIMAFVAIRAQYWRYCNNIKWTHWLLLILCHCSSISHVQNGAISYWSFDRHKWNCSGHSNREKEIHAASTICGFCSHHYGLFCDLP